jgi:hypothetical protein
VRSAQYAQTKILADDSGEAEEADEAEEATEAKEAKEAQEAEEVEEVEEVGFAALSGRRRKTTPTPHQHRTGTKECTGK